MTIEQDFLDPPGFPAAATRVIKKAGRCIMGKCFACGTMQDMDERCARCRHFPESVARASITGRYGATA